MYRTGTRKIWAPVVALALGLLAATARADEQDAPEAAPIVRPRSDAVYLIGKDGRVLHAARGFTEARVLLDSLARLQGRDLPVAAKDGHADAAGRSWTRARRPPGRWTSSPPRPRRC